MEWLFISVALVNYFTVIFGDNTRIQVGLIEYPAFAQQVTEVTLQNYEKNKKLSLVCSAREPVQMVYDYQLQNLKEIYFPQVNQYIERTSHDFKNSSTYIYKAFMNTRIKSFLELQYIQCKTIRDPANVKEIQFVQNETDLIISMDHKPVSSDIRFSRNVTEIEMIGAGVHFEVKSTLNGAGWKCIPDGASKSGVEAPSLHFVYCYTAVDCGNIMRSAQSENTAVRVLSTTEPCVDCLESFKYLSDEKKYHPQVVVCTYKNVRTAVAYFFSFPPNGSVDRPRLYLSLNDIRGEDMLFLEKPPTTNLTVGDTLEVTCIAVKYDFSQGFRVGMEMNGNLTLIPQGRHTYKRDKIRNAYIVKESIPLKEPGVGTVYCYAPVINSREWVNKSYTVLINEKPPPIEPIKDSINKAQPGGASSGAGGDGNSSQTIFIIVGLVVGMISLILIMGVVFFRRLRHVEEKFKRLSEADIRDFREGVANSETSKQSEGKRTSESNLKVEALPYNTKYEVSRKQIDIDGKQLGAGTYGIVVKGVVCKGSQTIPVAFKTIRTGVDVSYLKALLSELKIMAYLNNEHENIVHLVAACTEDIRNREVYVGVELCRESLLEALRGNEKRFVSLVENGELCHETYTSKSETADSYENVSIPHLSTHDLIRWSFQIADGMEFLSAKKVIHGDLAARNILLSNEGVAKICDFGLARQLVDYNYVKSEQCPLPWKWMAVESLASMNFSVKSDVWAYGVTLWEMFSLGQVPYPGLNWTTNFVKELANGLRMSSPDYSTSEIYDLIISCWQTEPKERPSFSELRAFFVELCSRLPIQATTATGRGHKNEATEYENVVSYLNANL